MKTNLLFFTKGQRTERIWYYDLSDVKVGKKSPLTLNHFEEFFRLLPDRTDSQRSWTVNFAARTAQANREAEPLRCQARAKEQEAAQERDRLAKLKRAKSSRRAIAEAEKRIAELSRAARELAGEAEEIENAVYDLKAVNPNAKGREDTRTVEELLNLIESKGREIAEALAILRGSGNAG